jgi:hypothetical protein
MQVTSKEGFFCTIRLAAVLPLTPAETFELLARPDSHNIFRSITVCRAPPATQLTAVPDGCMLQCMGGPKQDMSTLAGMRHAGQHLS